MCFAGLMEFKELFGSFTSHRVKNRSTGTRYGSTRSARSGNWRSGVQEAVADGYRAVRDELQIMSSAKDPRNQQYKLSDENTIRRTRRR
ncbi:hypothetical protein Hanom_Chr14g01326391 [Helianthus anomalus]